MWPPRVGLPMTNPALSLTALLTSSRGMLSRLRVLMPTPVQGQQSLVTILPLHSATLSNSAIPSRMYD